MLRKIQRSEWGARPPKAVPLGISTESSTDHWEGTTLGEFVHESCPTKVQVIQDFHMDSRNWNDIAYNFLVCPHGFAFVGRDHGIRSSANGTNEANAHSEAVCYLGGPGDTFTELAKTCFKELNEEIGGPTYPHSKWFNTACPGPEQSKWIADGQPVQKPIPDNKENNSVKTPCSGWVDPEEYHVIGLGEGNSLYTKMWSPKGGWTDWKNIGGVWPTQPDVFFRGDRIDVVGVGTDGAMYHLYYDHGKWQPETGPEPLRGKIIP